MIQMKMNWVSRKSRGRSSFTVRTCLEVLATGSSLWKIGTRFHGSNYTIFICQRFPVIVILLPPANEVCEGYVFTPVGQSFCSQGGGHVW